MQEIPEFVRDLSQVVQQDKTTIANLSATLSAVVDILKVIANVSTAVNVTTMQVRLKRLLTKTLFRLCLFLIDNVFIKLHGLYLTCYFV